MALLIVSIILTIILFIGLGFRYIPGEGRFDDGKISWKFSKRNLLSFLALIIVAFGFFTKIPANSVGIIYSPFDGTREQT